jgi:hypothetical protein
MLDKGGRNNPFFVRNDGNLIYNFYLLLFMSILDQEIQNPTQKYIKFKPNTGKFVYWDKDQKVEIIIDNLKVIELDNLTTITGYSDQYATGIYSNEVKNLLKEKIVVKTFKPKNILLQGLYADIKLRFDEVDAKYAKSIYGLRLCEDMTTEIVNIQLSGSSVGPYIDLKKKSDSTIVFSTNPEMQINKAVKYYIPKLEIIGTEVDTFELAKETYITTLKPYLDRYLKSNSETINVVADTDQVSSSDEDYYHSSQIPEIDLDGVHIPMPA